MKKVTKLTQSLEERINSKSHSRGEIEKFLFAFLRKFGVSYEVLKLVQSNTEKDDYIKHSYSQHIVSMISGIETLLRDIFIFIVTAFPEYQEWIIDKHQLVIKTQENEYHRFILAEMFNFQNVNDIELAFGLLLKTDNFFDEVGDIVIPVYNTEMKGLLKFSLNHSFPNWFKYLEELIEVRHRIVHDNNYILEIQYHNFEVYQEALLYFGQIFSLYVIGRFKLPYMALRYSEEKETIPFFARLRDFDSDWTEVKNEE